MENRQSPTRDILAWSLNIDQESFDMTVKHRDSSHLEDVAEKGGCPILLPEPREIVDTDSCDSSDPTRVKRSVGKWYSTDRIGSYLQYTVPSEKLRIPLYLQAFSTG